MIVLARLGIRILIATCAALLIVQWVLVNATHATACG